MLLTKKRIALISVLNLFVSINSVQAKDLINTNQLIISQNHSTFTSLFKPPSQDRQPKITFGGAARGDNCSLDSQNQERMAVLISDNNNTAKNLPEFLVYVPQGDSQKAIVTIKDESEDYYYREPISIGQPGNINKIKISEKAPPLEKGKEYVVYLKLICAQAESPTDPEIAFKVSPVEAENSQVELEEKVKYYMEKGIWFDAIQTAYELKENHNNSTYWNELLKATGNEKFIN